MNDLIIREQELVNNPTARVPICLVLDTSGSMYGNPIDELNRGVNMFFNAIKEDEIAQYSAEISIVTFGGSVSKLLDFDSINNQIVPKLTADGGTPMGEGVNSAIDLLEQRKKEYSNAGVDYYQPWMVLMTDGAPTDSIESAVSRTCKLVNSRKLTIFPIGIGDSADMSTLSRFSPKRPALRLQGLNFKEFFEWLSQSVSRVSQSTPGETVELDIEGIKGWATLYFLWRRRRIFMNDLVLKENWLVENPTARVPIVLCLDCSPSMSGKIEWGASPNINGVPIDELNEGVSMFFNSVKNDEIAKMSAEISVVAFSSVVEQILDFDYIDNIIPPTLELETRIGGTSIGKAVDKSIKILEKRKKEYSKAGVDYYQPWLVVMTDGSPTDDTHIEVSKMVSTLVNEKKLTIFPIAIGDGADLSTLKMFSPKRPPLKLQGLNFKDFFEWLSQSVSRVSQSTPGEIVPLDIDGIKGWAEL